VSATTTPAPEFGVDVPPAAIPAWARENAIGKAVKYGYASGIYLDAAVSHSTYVVGPIEFAGRWRRRYGYELAAVVYPVGVEMSHCENCDREWPLDQLAGKLAAICPPCRGEEPAR
jgi:hypothetical protein